MSWVLVGLLAGIPLALLLFRSARRHFALGVIVWLAALLVWIVSIEPGTIDCLRQGGLSC